MLWPVPFPKAKQRRRWRVFVYALMVLIVVGLLFLLHLVSAIQSSQDMAKRVEMARRVVDFQLPTGYALTSALYTFHPRFFVLTHEETDQKIRVMERRGWARDRTPDQFQSRFGHPGQWIDRPGLGYRSILVERQGQLSPASGTVPYVVGLLGSGEQRAERGLVACLYNSSTDKSIYVFSSAAAEVFDPTQALRFIDSLAPNVR